MSVISIKNMRKNNQAILSLLIMLRIIVEYGEHDEISLQRHFAAYARRFANKSPNRSTNVIR
jgi:hypothetical protein